MKATPVMLEKGLAAYEAKQREPEEPPKITPNEAFTGSGVETFLDGLRPKPEPIRPVAKTPAKSQGPWYKIFEKIFS